MIYLLLIPFVLLTLAFYFMLRKSLFTLIFSFICLGHGVNFILFFAGDLARNQNPLVSSPETSVDPLPQALILTAIVISFAVSAFAAVLIKRYTQEKGSDALENIRGERS